MSVSERKVLFPLQRFDACNQWDGIWIFILYRTVNTSFISFTNIRGIISLHFDSRTKHSNILGARRRVFNAKASGAYSYHFLKVLWGNSYCICTGKGKDTGWTVRRSNPGEGGEIVHTRPVQIWGPPSLLYHGYRVTFPGVSGWCVALTMNPHLAPRPLWGFVACSRVNFIPQ